METKTDKKLRGGYYTPNEIASFVTCWVINRDSKLILEPSCGDGQFIEAAINRLSVLGLDKKLISSKIIGIELDAVEAKKTSERFTKHLLNSEGTIKTGDFFAQCSRWLDEAASFDGVIGNPPFIRYQDFPEKYRNPALGLMTRAGLKPNKLMNAWIPFLVGSTLLLSGGGRIGFVIPAELFQVKYAAEIRKFLSDSYSKIIFVTFKELVFEGIQQEVVLFLGEKNGKKSHGINIIQVGNVNDLKSVDLENVIGNLKVLESSTEKWTQYFLEDTEVELIRKLRKNPEISLAKEHLSVDVGAVTGQNKYFVLNQNQVVSHHLGDYTQKIFSKSIQLKGIVASQDDFDQSVQKKQSNFLLRLPDVDFKKIPASVQKYISFGENDGIDKGYKCRIRKRWWVVPSVWVPDAFMLRQVYNYPKLILNECRATSTDTVHRVRFANGVNGKHITAAFLNSMTLAFSEITGRSYGGGVLTFEPSEAEQLPLPLKGSERLDTKKIDSLVRSGEIEKALDITDRILLEEGLGLTQKEIASLRKIWKKLRDRRINRRVKS